VSALTITLDNPHDNFVSRNSEITFAYSLEGAENVTNCCLILNNTPTICSPVPNSTFVYNPADGSYNWGINCSFENASEMSGIAKIIIDTTKPAISILSPITGRLYSRTIPFIHRESDANLASCYLSVNGKSFVGISCNADTEVDTMNCADGINSCIVQLLATDEAGNNNTQITVFSVDNREPTVTVSVNSPSPIKSGTFEVALNSSEDLSLAELEYSLDNTPGIKQPISLLGSGKIWKGYMIIPPSFGTRIGTFYFNGRDIAGNNGSIITGGKLFIIDTVAPSAPRSIKLIKQSNDDIKVEWYYDGEPAEFFNIYRSTETGVQYVDQYDTTTGSYYIDTKLDDTQTYYYRVSAVDEAGNNGDLSPEISITPSEQEAIQEKTPAPKEVVKPVVETPQPAIVDNTPKASDIQINDLLYEADRLSVDISWVISNFQNKEDVVEKHIVTDLEFIVIASSAQQEVDLIRKQLSDLQTSAANEDVTLKELNLIDLHIKKIRQTTPRNTVILQKNEFVQSTTAEDISHAIDALLAGNKNLSVFAKNSYKEQNKELQNFVNINTEVDVLTVEYLDKSKTNISTVTKKLTYQSPDTLQNVVLVETIPKSVANSANELQVKTENYEILQDDPILAWKFDKFNYEERQIKYVINKRVDDSIIDGIKSVILLDPNNFAAEQGSSKISGFSIFSFGANFGNMTTISIIIGFIIVALLSGYYVVFVRGMPDMKKIFSVRRFSQKKTQKARISDALSEVRDYLEVGDYAKAQALYPNIKQLYDAMPKESKAEFYQQCADLHKKIIELTKK
jgi:hypothetical protein